MIKIIKKNWVYNIDGIPKDINMLRSISHKTCERCGTRLSTSYNFLIHSIKDFLPDDYEHLCCPCNIRERIGIEKAICDECDTAIFIEIRGDYLWYWCGFCNKIYYKGDLNGNRNKKIQAKDKGIRETG